LSPPPLPPVNFHGPIDPPASGAMSEPTAAVTQGGRKKLRDMTDFFNPVESADI
jgi:hypothetical protein